jgi:hypothetical protein
MLNTKTRLVTLAGKEESLSIVITLMLSIGGLLVTLVITDTGSAGFLVVLPVLHTKAAFIAVDVGFLSARFLIILMITEFLSHVKTTLTITRPRLSGTRLLIVIITGFPAINIISTRLDTRFLVVLITLLSTMFLSLIKVTLISEDTTAYTKPLIPLHLNTTVFLNLDQAIIKVML